MPSCEWVEAEAEVECEVLTGELEICPTSPRNQGNQKSVAVGQ